MAPLSPGAAQLEHLSHRLAVAASSAKLAPDAHIAALAIEVVKVAGGYYQDASRSFYNLELPDGQPVALAGEHRLMFNVEPYFRVLRTESQTGGYHVEIVGYHYTVHDSEQREVLAYHWHPSPQEFIRTPHLHLGSGARVGFDPLVSKTHLPTGFVTLGEIIRVLIQDLSIRPRHSAWETVVLGIVEPVPTR